MESMVVARRQIEGGEESTLIFARVFLIAEQLRQGITPPLNLNERADFDPTRFAPRAITGRNEASTLSVNLASFLAKCSRKKTLERVVGLDGFFRLSQIDTGQTSEESNLETLNRAGPSQTSEATRHSRERILR